MNINTENVVSKFMINYTTTIFKLNYLRKYIYGMNAVVSEALVIMEEVWYSCGDHQALKCIETEL